MRPTILYIACSLDGYIAKENGDIGFLSTVERHGEDYGYNDFIKTVDTVIMGRKTFDKVLSFGIESPHLDKKCYVLSRTKKGKNENVEYYNGNVSTLISTIRKSEGLNIYIDGGSETISEFLNNNLIDTFIISVVPVLLGNGIPLFKKGIPEIALNLTKNISFPSGLVQLWYEKI